MFLFSLLFLFSGTYRRFVTTVLLPYNGYHLQALPHLYTLEVEERTVEAVDVDSNKELLLPMKASEQILEGLQIPYNFK